AAAGRERVSAGVELARAWPLHLRLAGVVRAWDPREGCAALALCQSLRRLVTAGAAAGEQLGGRPTGSQILRLRRCAAECERHRQGRQPVSPNCGHVKYLPSPDRGDELSIPSSPLAHSRPKVSLL